MTPKLIAMPNVNLRTGPGTGRSIIRQMAAGTLVQLFDGLTVTNNTSADKYTWQAILLSDNTIGWCVNAYGGTPMFLPPTTVKHSRDGMHLLPGGNSNDWIDIAQRLKDAGRQMGGVLVAGEAPLAAALVGKVGRVIYRVMKVQPWSPDYDPDPTRAYEQGRQWVRDRSGEIVGLPEEIVIAYTNEGKWKPTEADFWRGVLDENGGKRKLALYADAVGHPTDDDGISAETRWNARLPILRRARLEGHVYAFHIYSAPGTPAGLLSAIDKRHDYETRFRRFKSTTPSDAQIPFVVTEASCEYENGTYTGEQPTIAWLKALLQEYAGDDCIEFVCQYTAGVWKSSSIDAARAALETLFRGSL